MKATDFAFTFPLGDLKTGLTQPGVLLYNAFTSSLAAIEEDKYQTYIDFCKDGTPIKDNTLVEQLKLGGFLVEDGYDEKQELKLRILRSRFQTSSFGLTIAPTSDCNFRCVYCYEKDQLRPSYMSDEVMEKVVDLLRARAGAIKTFSVTWYGGEPLLALNVIEKLSEQFINICDENDVQYSAGIVTNGSLLKRATVEKLNALKVNFYQITVDGTRENHNRTRPFKGGGATYDIILDNIEECYDLLPTVSLRVNVDKSSISAAEDIRSTLRARGIDGKVKPYLGKITNDNNDPALSSVCFTGQEFTSSLLDFWEADENKDELWLGKYPTVKGNYCGADSQSSFVVDSDGLLYKCWSDIGKTGCAVGCILTGGQLNHEVTYRYMAFDPTEDPDCSECKYLPLCAGGCPYQRNAGHREECCTTYKYALEHFLRNAASAAVSLKSEQQAKQ